MDRPRLTPEDLQTAHQLSHVGLTRLVVFIVLWTIATALGSWAYVHAWPVLVLTVPLAAGSLHGISLFTHEGVHGALFRNRRLNGLVSAVCAWPVLQNFSGYRVLHLRHHADLGGTDDPDHYANYTRWTWGIFLMNWGRLLLGYPAYITLIPILGFKHGSTRDRIGILLELVGVACTLSLLVQLPWPALLTGWIVPMVCINTMVNIRGMSQHTLLPDPTHPVLGSRTIRTNPLVQFFMCNENFHLEHHLYPNVPWYRLPWVHERLDLREAPVIPSYTSFVRHFVRESVRRGPLGGS